MAAKQTTKAAEGTPTAAEQKAYEQGQDQFPSLDGHASVEIAQRSQDEDNPTATVHRKTFVVLASTWGESVDHDVSHLHNIEATRQAMIHQGLRPTGDGKFVGDRKHEDGVSLYLDYEVPCTPAVIASSEDEPLVAHARVTLDEQHAAEKDA